MSRFYTIPTSNKGSVKYLEGTFFDYDMQDIYVPLDNKDFRNYLEFINEQENMEGRRLTHDELLRLSTEYVSDLSV